MKGMILERGDELLAGESGGTDEHGTKLGHGVRLSFEKGVRWRVFTPFAPGLHPLPAAVAGVSAHLAQGRLLEVALGGQALGDPPVQAPIQADREQAPLLEQAAGPIGVRAIRSTPTHHDEFVVREDAGVRQRSPRSSSTRSRGCADRSASSLPAPGSRARAPPRPPGAHRAPCKVCRASTQNLRLRCPSGATRSAEYPFPILLQAGIALGRSETELFGDDLVHDLAGARRRWAPTGRRASGAGCRTPSCSPRPRAAAGTRRRRGRPSRWPPSWPWTSGRRRTRRATCSRSA